MNEPGSHSIISQCLVEALEDDPFYSAITRDFFDNPLDRKAALGAYFEYSMAEGERLGCCTVIPDELLGAAVWTKPIAESMALESMHEKHRFLESTLGPEGLRDYHKIIGFMSAESRRVVGKDAWYLSILGVSPRAQNRGLGRRLVEPTLEEADLENATCYLETFSRRSIRFYERFAFRRVASIVEPVTSSEYVIMVRAPFQAII